MIAFVLESPGQESFCRQSVMISLPVLEMDGDLGRPLDFSFVEFQLCGPVDI